MKQILVNDSGVQFKLTKPYATHSVPLTQLMKLSGQYNEALFLVIKTYKIDVSSEHSSEKGRVGEPMQSSQITSG